MKKLINKNISDLVYLHHFNQINDVIFNIYT
jgi:hypothetical protein